MLRKPKFSVLKVKILPCIVFLSSFLSHNGNFIHNYKEIQNKTKQKSSPKNAEKCKVEYVLLQKIAKM